MVLDEETVQAVLSVVSDLVEILEKYGIVLFWLVNSNENKG